MVFQEPMTALNPLHTVGHQIAEPLRVHLGLSPREARARALQLLERVRVPQAARRLDAYPHQMSGGQRQRVVIAIALACGPDLLIADEPTTALDVTVQREVLDLIGELVAERGMGLLLISHNLGVMARTVRRLMVMYGGIVAESGPTDSVFARLAHPYTRALFAAASAPRAGARHAAADDSRAGARTGRPAQGLSVRRPLHARGRRVPRRDPTGVAGERARPHRSAHEPERAARRSSGEPGARCALPAHARRTRGGACLSRWSRPGTSAATTGCRAKRCSARRRWCARSTT